MTERKYQPIWDRIKQNGSCTVEVEPFILARVKKAIIKEKNKDVGFKVLNTHDNFFLEFEYDKEKKRLKTTLKQTIGLQGAVT